MYPFCIFCIQCPFSSRYTAGEGKQSVSLLYLLHSVSLLQPLHSWRRDTECIPSVSSAFSIPSPAVTQLEKGNRMHHPVEGLHLQCRWRWNALLGQWELKVARNSFQHLYFDERRRFHWHALHADVVVVVCQ